MVSFFSEEVAERVPSMWRILCLIWLCHIVLSISLISRPDQSKIDQFSIQNPLVDTNEEGVEKERKFQLRSYTSSFKSVRLLEYFLMMFFGVLFQGVFAYVFKPIGLQEGLDDSFLAWAGSTASIV